MKCLVFDRGDGVLGLGLMILYGGLNQFSIVWPDRPPERMTEDFLKSNGIKILGESELSPPMDPPLVPVVDPVTPDEPLVASINETPLANPPVREPLTPVAPTVVPDSSTAPPVPPAAVTPPTPPEPVVPSSSSEASPAPANPSGSAIELV